MRVADRYEVQRELGRGAFAAVYLAADAVSGEPVALKWMITPDDPTYHREIARLALLDGPGIARLRDHGRWEGREFLVLDYIDGEPFPSGPLPWDRLEPLATSLLAALARIHRRGVIHGDIRPENALVSGDRVTLLDFGSVDGVRHGLWVAPEVFTGGASTALSDVFSAALLIAAASSGIPPWHHTEAAVARTSGQAPRVVLDGVPPHVAEALRAALSPARPTLDELAAAFSSSGPAPLPDREAKWTLAELQDLFEGPEPIVHLRTRPAALVFGATAGDPEQVAAILSRWERTGKIRRIGSCYRATRAGLDEEEADQEIAAVVAGDSPQRSLWGAAEGAIEQGRVRQGVFLLRAAALAARSAQDELIERMALETLTERAVYGGDLATAEREVAASKSRHADLEAIVRALRAHANGDPGRCLALASVIPEPTNEYLAAAVQAVRVAAALRLGPDTFRWVVDETRDWAARRGTAYSRARAGGWAGMYAHRVSQYAVAADLHLASIAGRERPTERLSAQLNAASAWLEAHDHREALRLCQDALTLAVRVGHAVYEARALRLLRECQYRSAGSLDRDDALVAACDDLEADQSGFLLMHEAAGAWRRGELHLGGILAEKAVTALVASRHRSAELLSWGLVSVCRGSLSDDDVAGVLAGAAAEDIETIAMQVYAMLAAGGVPRPRGFVARWAHIPDDARILDVLSVREARAMLQERWGSSL